MRLLSYPLGQLRLVFLPLFLSSSCDASLFPAVAADAVLLSLSEDRVRSEGTELGVGGDVHVLRVSKLNGGWARCLAFGANVVQMRSHPRLGVA